MYRFKIQDSYADAVESNTFVFEGKVIEGGAKVGMTFRVPEAGHTWTFLIKSIRFIPRAGGGQLLGLEVKNVEPGYHPGLGVGWTTELYEE
jgi:hypothetical protein